jgi:hypothetical protein
MQTLTSFSQFQSTLRDSMDQYVETLGAGDPAAVFGSRYGANGQVRETPRVTPTVIQDVTAGQCRSSQLDAGPVPPYEFEQLLLPAQSFTQQMKSSPLGNNGAPTLAGMFLAPQNVKRVLEQARGHLSYAFQRPVHIPVDDMVIDTFVKLMQDNSGAPQTPEYAQRLSETAMNRLLQDRYYGLRQRDLYHRYFIDQDRMRTMPRPDYQGIARGEVLIDTSGTTLGHPASRFQAQFLRDVMMPIRTQRLDSNMCEPRDGFY